MTALLTHRIDGNGEPIVLLNGGMMTLANWDEIAGRLQARWRVIRCDLRGQVLTPGPPFNTTMAGHAGDVVALFDALGVARAHVVGTSFGAEVGMLLAAIHPARVASLVAATASDWITPSMREQIVALRRGCDEALSGGNRHALYDRLAPMTYSPAHLAAHAAILAERRTAVAALPDAWFQGTASILDALADLDLRPHLPKIACPTLVVIAGHDDIMPLERSRAITRAIPAAEEVLVPSSGHALVVEQPDVFLGLTEQFLSRHPMETPRGPSGTQP
jgi:pimeloyl-ACP methyl ester carboxylesterase